MEQRLIMMKMLMSFIDDFFVFMFGAQVLSYLTFVHEWASLFTDLPFKATLDPH